MILHKDDTDSIERIIRRMRDPAKAAAEISKWLACRFAPSKDGSPFSAADVDYNASNEGCRHRYVRPLFVENADGKFIVGEVKCAHCGKAMAPEELGFTFDVKSHVGQVQSEGVIVLTQE